MRLHITKTVRRLSRHAHMGGAAEPSQLGLLLLQWIRQQGRRAGGRAGGRSETAEYVCK